MADDTEYTEELAALLALDALPADEQADAELRLGTFPAELSSVVAALAEATADEPPAHLRPATLQHALSRRAAGRPSNAVQPCRPSEAYDRTVADFHHLLASLSDDEWQLPAHDDHGDVRELVAHLVGVERLCRAWLDPAAAPPVDPEIDHVSSTLPVVDELADASPAAVADQWHEAALAVARQAASGDPSRPVSFHDITGTVDGLLVTRTFELWAHGMDIALATGRPLPALDPERMALLAARLMAVLPLAMAYRGRPVPTGTARFVLTGEAGGTYTVGLDLGRRVSDDGPADVTILADVNDICRVAARRLAPEALDALIEGDAELARAVLARVDAFARD